MSSRSLNRIELIGNLTRDPELKYTPNGTAVCSFGVATNRGWTTVNGEQKEEVQFHRIVAWQKLAELCSKLLTKGKKVYVVGRITYRNYSGKDGVQRSITEIVLDDFIVFDSNKKIATETASENKENEEIKNEIEEVPTSEDFTQTEEINSEKVSPDDIPF